MPGSESAKNAHRLARTAGLAGLSVHMAPYWPDGEPAWSDEAPLLQADIASAPRLSAFAFEQRFGFDLDLIDLSLHLFATEPATPSTVLPETIWKQRLRGVAATAIDLIQQTDAEIIFVPHGAEVISRILAEVASAMRRRLLFWESGFFPGHLYLDPLAPHFFRGATRIDATASATTPSTRARAFREEWKARRRSKYPQSRADHQVLANWLSNDARRVVFLPGQVPTDANAVVGLGPFESLGALYRDALEHIPAHWRVLYKPHPLAPQDPLADVKLPPDKFLRLDLDVHDVIEASDAVLVHSSNVGLEALLCGKPVLTLGRPIYSKRGLTIDLDHPQMLKDTLVNDAPPPCPSDDAILSFLDLLLDEALIADDDAQSLSERIQRACPGAAQSPRQAWYGDSVRALADTARAVHDALRTSVRLDRALDALTPEHRGVLDRYVGLNALKPHRFGGPAVPRSRYIPRSIPDLDALTGARAIYNDLRLDECVDPVAALKASQHESSSRPYIMRFASNSPSDSIQKLSKSDIRTIFEHAHGRSGRCDILGLNDRNLALPEMAPEWIAIATRNPASDTAISMDEQVVFRPLIIPDEAFKGAAHTPPNRLVLTADGPTFPRYGCSLTLPSGQWSVSWRAPWWGWADLWTKRPQLKLELVMRTGGKEIVTRAPWGAGTLQFSLDQKIAVELRLRYRPRKFGALKHVTLSDVTIEDRTPTATLQPYVA